MRSARSYPAAAVKIETNEVLRYLAYGQKEKETPRWIREIIEHQIAAARPLLDPWGIYSLSDAVSLRQHEILRDAEKIVFGICTIGQQLEEMAEGCFRKKEYLEGLVLDAIGTVATENLVQLIHNEIRQDALRLGLFVSGRFSPGHMDWQLDDQRLIFQHFDGEVLKVRTNESFMMTPRKSLSFAYKLGTQEFEGSEQEACRKCNFSARCAFREGDRDVTCSEAARRAR